jgi:ERCC4-related helicase
MSTSNLQDAFKNRGCFPHQAEFAEKFFVAGSARKHLLLSAPGMGKRFVSAAIVAHAVESEAAKRVLILTPSPLVAMWQDVVQRAAPKVTVISANMRKIRELEMKGKDSLWPEAAVIVTSIDLAAKGDVAGRFADTRWDLIVVDESHRLNPQTQRFALVAQLLDRSPSARVLLLRSTPPRQRPRRDPQPDVVLQDAVSTQWSRESVRDHDGAALFPETHFEWITYERQAEESRILDTLQELLRTASQSSPVARMQAATLLQTASSSLFAIEQRLRRLNQPRKDIAQGIGATGEGDVDTDEVPFEVPSGDVSQKELPLDSDSIGRLLQMLESVETDSKLDALTSLLSKEELTGEPVRRVCVFTKYADTAPYLEAAISEKCANVSVLTSRQSFSEWEQVMASFEKTGGVLIATEAIPATMPDVAAVIFYDLPLNPLVLEERIGQFVRVGRQEPVRVIAFTDGSNSFAVERLQRHLAEHREVLTEPELQRRLFSEE